MFHGGLTKQGNKWLRWAVVEAVRPAVTTDPDLRRYYERLRQRKGPNPAKVARARRLLLLTHRVLTHERPYRKPASVTNRPQPRAASRTPYRRRDEPDARSEKRIGSPRIQSLACGLKEAPRIEG